MSTKKIGTHDGTFHCDEALGCYLLQHTNLFKGADIIRSRDTKILDTLDCLVDVGGVYDNTKHRYDHHQRGFFQTFDDKYKTKLSSSGLVYKHFGKEVITNLLGTDESTTEVVYHWMYKSFMEAIDAIDNGISQTDETPRYRISTDLSNRVKDLNPAWNEKDVDIEGQFKKAMALTGKEFEDKLNSCFKRWLPARKIVENAVNERTKYSNSGEIIVLSTACPWQSHLFEIEQDLGIQGQIKYAIFGQNEDWRVQCVPPEDGSFESRIPLPEPWRGKRDKDLNEISGIQNCIFAHHSGFIGGNKTFEGALQMAKLSLSLKSK